MIHPLVKKMLDGDINAIIEGMMNYSAIFRTAAIVGAVNNNIDLEPIKGLLQKLQDDHFAIFGYEIAELATAALIKLSGESYAGDNYTVRMLVDTPIWFQAQRLI